MQKAGLDPAFVILDKAVSAANLDLPDALHAPYPHDSLADRAVPAHPAPPFGRYDSPGWLDEGIARRRRNKVLICGHWYRSRDGERRAAQNQSRR